MARDFSTLSRCRSGSRQLWADATSAHAVQLRESVGSLSIDRAIAVARFWHIMELAEGLRTGRFPDSKIPLAESRRHEDRKSLHGQYPSNPADDRRSHHQKEFRSDGHEHLAPAQRSGCVRSMKAEISVVVPAAIATRIVGKPWLPSQALSVSYSRFRASALSMSTLAASLAVAAVSGVPETCAVTIDPSSRIASDAAS